MLLGGIHGGLHAGEEAAARSYLDCFRVHHCGEGEEEDEEKGGRPRGNQSHCVSINRIL